MLNTNLTISSPITLNNGVKMPILGFGTYRLADGPEAEKATSWALEAGYRLIDTASFYGNEESVGRAIKNSGISRPDIFLTTKLWLTDFSNAETAFKKSIEKLGLEYIDLYLIHWPVPILRNRAWKALENIYSEGRVRAIGVSNYSIEQLQNLLGMAKIIPAVNQIEFNPFSHNNNLTDFCKLNGIEVEAYSPLSGGHNLDNITIKEIAHKHNKSSAQIMLRWAIQKGAAAIPKSSHKMRVVENSNIFDFQISEGDMVKLNELGRY